MKDLINLNNQPGCGSINVKKKKKIERQQQSLEFLRRASVKGKETWSR